MDRVLPLRSPSRIATWVLLALMVSGCSSWQGVKGGPTAAPPTTQALPGKVRVQLQDGSVFAMEHATVDGDSLRGTVPTESAMVRSSRPVAVALKDIRAIESRQFDAGSTLGVLAAMGFVVFGLLYLVASSLD